MKKKSNKNFLSSVRKKSVSSSTSDADINRLPKARKSQFFPLNYNMSPLATPRVLSDKRKARVKNKRFVFSKKEIKSWNIFGKQLKKGSSKWKRSRKGSFNPSVKMTEKSIQAPTHGNNIEITESKVSKKY